MDLNDTLTIATPSSSWIDQLNSSGNSTTPEPEVSLYTYPERVVVAVFSLLISLVDITGNSTVILAVVFSKKLQTATNVFVVSLSVADLLTGLGLPMSAVGLLSPGNTWPWSTEVPCFIGALLLYISAGASLLHLACIALNRAVLIKRPMTTYLWLYTRRNLAIMVAAIWIISTSVMLIPPLFDVGGFGYDKYHHTCTDLQKHPRAKTFDKIQTFTFFVVPVIVIFACYIVIFIHVRRHFKTQKAQRQDNISAVAFLSTSKAGTETPSSAAVGEDSGKHRISRQQFRITKNLFTVVCVFFLCVTPYVMVNLFTTANRALVFTSILFLCNSCANPFVYTAKHPQFKTVIRRMLQCKYSQIEEPSDALKFLMARCNKRHQSRSQKGAPPSI